MPAKTNLKAALLSDFGVLAVDDNANTRRLLKELLTAFGVNDLRLAADGVTALEMIRERTPDLILCDWNMSPMDGIQFLRRLRHKEFGAICQAPAIMLTAHTKPEVVKASMDAGANHFVAKPIVPANLLKRIQLVRTDQRIFVLEGNQYVLRDPKPKKPAKKIPQAPKAVAASRGARSVWEV